MDFDFDRMAVQLEPHRGDSVGTLGRCSARCCFCSGYYYRCRVLLLAPLLFGPTPCVFAHLTHRVREDTLAFGRSEHLEETGVSRIEWPFQCWPLHSMVLLFWRLLLQCRMSSFDAKGSFTRSNALQVLRLVSLDIIHQQQRSPTRKVFDRIVDQEIQSSKHEGVGCRMWKVETERSDHREALARKKSRIRGTIDDLYRTIDAENNNNLQETLILNMSTMMIRKLDRIASIAPRWNQLRRSRARCFSSTGTETPFYGSPRPEAPHRSLQNRLAVAIHSATTAFADPSRADAVAALGEITGEVSLRRIHAKMSNDPTGRLILQERPVVSKATIPYERLMAEAPEDATTTPGITFGQAYGSFLKGHGFDPDARDQVKYVDDEGLAYVMLRYRQVGTRRKMLLS